MGPMTLLLPGEKIPCPSQGSTGEMGTTVWTMEEGIYYKNEDLYNKERS